MNCLLIPMLMLACHNLDTTTPLQDVLNRWLDGADMQTFNVLAQNWQNPGFISTNPCITFTVKSDVNLTAVFEPIPEPVVVDPAAVEPEQTDRERLYPLLEPVWKTHTGKRYHTETCFWRGLIPVETTVLQAMLDGLTACGHCKPPRIEDNDPNDAM